jgi:hypothetical protein
VDFLRLWKGVVQGGYVESEHIHEMSSKVSQGRGAGRSATVWAGCRILDLGRKGCPDQERPLLDPRDLPRCPVRFARIDEPILCFKTAIGMTDGKTHSGHPPKPNRRQGRSLDIFFDRANMCCPVFSMPNAVRASLLWLPSQWLLGVELRINTQVRAAPLISRPKSHTEIRSQRSL